MSLADQYLGAIDEGAISAEIAYRKERLDRVTQTLKITMNHFAIAQASQDLAIEDKANYLDRNPCTRS
jgi:hypothetical protein